MFCIFVLNVTKY